MLWPVYIIIYSHSCLCELSLNWEQSVSLSDMCAIAQHQLAAHSQQQTRQLPTNVRRIVRQHNAVKARSVN